MKTVQVTRRWGAGATAPALRATPSAAAHAIMPLAADATELAARKERRARFERELADAARAAGVAKKETLQVARAAAAGGHAHGRSEALERDYLRLTSLPGVDDVRPPHILAVSLENVKARWVAVRPVGLAGGDVPRAQGRAASAARTHARA